MAMAHSGLAKLIEECGELQQVSGKVLAYGLGDHPDGVGNLKERLEDEIADVMAICMFCITHLELDEEIVKDRITIKSKNYKIWSRQP